MLSLILLQQIAQLFIIIFLGWAIVKAGILKSEDSRVLSMLLLYVIIPCVILNAFQIERTTDTVRMMELSLLSALMMKFVTGALTDADVILYVTDTVEQSERSAEIVDSIRRSGIPTVVVINKIDLSTPDVMRIRGGAIRPARVFSHGDHRIAMSMAVSALRSSGTITIEGAEAVAKSYPRFFEDLESLRVN